MALTTGKCDGHTLYYAVSSRKLESSAAHDADEHDIDVGLFPNVLLI